jgi:hypothetical protein
MVECPQPYEEIVKAGWASDPNTRPNVHEIVEVLERVLISTCTPTGLRLEVYMSTSQLILN